MILLDGHSLTPARKVPAEALSLTINERESTADFTPADATGITVNSWFMDDTEPGKGIVWRVSTLRTDYHTDTVRLGLEHVIGILKDTIMFGEVTPKDIAGGSATTCTAEQAVRYILGKQRDWVLGSFSYGSVRNAYTFDGDNLFDALEAVTETCADACWTYDMSAYPFKLNITRMSDTVGSELRAGRNLVTISRVIDRSSMYTRFYPIGAEDLHLPESYVQKNTDQYGVVSKVDTDTNLKTVAELRSWANDRLRRHAEPGITDEVEGLELARATGESLDSFQICRMCRVPLPDYGTTITERIVQLNYPDKVHRPESVRVTMGNARRDVAKIIAEEMKKGGRGGRGAARKDKEDHAWFIDTDEHVGMVAEAVAGPGADKNWSRVSSIIADGTGLHQRVTYAEDDIVKAEARIDVTENRITQEVKERKDQDTELSSRITQEADRISLVVTKSNGKDVIKSASIITAINNDKSSVKISADKIILDGEAVAKSLQTHKLTSPNIEVGLLTIDGTFSFNGSIVRWQNTPVVTGITRGSSRRVVYATDNQMSNLAFEWGTIVSGVDTATLHYLGRSPT